jgi:WhiB family transcriptional regulator, redox-sensing transcriptional regulator
MRGACRQADPELFFPVSTAQGPARRQAEAAKAICAQCPVRAMCLTYALEVMPEGIWGGTTSEERRSARRRISRRQASAPSVETVIMEMAGVTTPGTGDVLGHARWPSRSAS